MGRRGKVRERHLLNVYYKSGTVVGMWGRWRPALLSQFCSELVLHISLLFAAVTNYHKLDDLKQHKLLSYSYGDQKSKTAGLCSF